MIFSPSFVHSSVLFYRRFHCGRHLKSIPLSYRTLHSITFGCTVFARKNGLFRFFRIKIDMLRLKIAYRISQFQQNEQHSQGLPAQKPPGQAA